MLLLLLRLLCNKDLDPQAYRIKHLWHLCGKTKAVIQTLLKCLMLKPYKATIVMVEAPNLDDTDLTLWRKKHRYEQSKEIFPPPKYIQQPINKQIN